MSRTRSTSYADGRCRRARGRGPQPCAGRPHWIDAS